MDDLIATLRRKGLVEVDEHLIVYAGEWMRIETGDRYLGQHGDQKPELLTCRRREVQRRGSGRVLGKFFPKERKDSRGKTPRLYTLNEVIKVVIRDNPNYDPTKKKEQIDERTAAPDPQGPEPREVHGNGEDHGNAGAVPVHDGEGAAADDRSGQRADSDGAREGDAAARPAAAPKPGPRPGPKPPKRGAEHRDPRQPGGRTDYSAASRKSDD